MSMVELLKAVWDFDISICPECGHRSMKQLGRCYAPSWSSWLLILFWKSLPTGGFKSMPCNVLHHENLRVFSRSPGKSDNLNHLGTIQSPYTHRLNVRELAQLWRITFRAVRVSYRTALFVCSKYDTSLMNYNTSYSYYYFVTKDKAELSSALSIKFHTLAMGHVKNMSFCLWNISGNLPVIRL